MPYSQYMEVYNLTAKTEGNILYLSAARDFGRAKQFFDSYLAIPAPPHSSSSKQVLKHTNFKDQIDSFWPDSDCRDLYAHEVILIFNSSGPGRDFDLDHYQQDEPRGIVGPLKRRYKKSRVRL